MSYNAISRREQRCRTPRRASSSTPSTTKTSRRPEVAGIRSRRRPPPPFPPVGRVARVATTRTLLTCTSSEARKYRGQANPVRERIRDDARNGHHESVLREITIASRENRFARLRRKQISGPEVALLGETGRRRLRLKANANASSSLDPVAGIDDETRRFGVAKMM